ncbi:hypothetical protein Tco_1248555 [Tanacetum coccineum]
MHSHSGFDTFSFQILLRLSLLLGIGNSYSQSSPSNVNPSTTSRTSEIIARIPKKELKLCEAKTAKSSIDEPPEVELKDLHSSRYAFLEDKQQVPLS